MLSEKNTEILTACPLFKGLNQSETASLISSAGYHIRHFAKNTLIASRQDRCQNLGIVLTGSVKGEMLDLSGKVVNIENIDAPFPYAVAFLFGQNNCYPVDVISREEADILLIPRSSVILMMQNNQFFLQNFLDLISTKTQFLSEKIWFISFKTIRQKIIHYFLEIATDGRNQFKLEKTQQELADLFGVTRPSLSRVLGELNSEGLIRLEKKELTILNRKQMISELDI